MLYLKALHIIFVITWFAGLFYIVRLFVYHAEAQNKSEPEKSILSAHFKLASRRLWMGITWPSMILTWVLGPAVMISAFGEHMPDWLILKFIIVVLLTVYHFVCHRIYLNFQKDKFNWTSMRLRLWNEVATIFLVSIVFIVVMKDLTNWLYGLLGLMGFTLLLLISIKLYKKQREKN